MTNEVQLAIITGAFVFAGQVLAAWHLARITRNAAAAVGEKVDSGNKVTAEVYTKVDGNLSAALLKLEAMEKTLRDAGVQLPTKALNGDTLKPTQPPPNH